LRILVALVLEIWDAAGNAGVIAIGLGGESSIGGPHVARRIFFVEKRDARLGSVRG